MSSPNPGAKTKTVISARLTTSTSACPIPTVSTMTGLHPEPAMILAAAPAAAHTPPQSPPRCHRTYEDVLVNGMPHHPDTISQEGPAGYRRRRINGHNANAKPLPAIV